MNPYLLLDIGGGAILPDYQKKDLIYAQPDLEKNTSQNTLDLRSDHGIQTLLKQNHLRRT